MIDDDGICPDCRALLTLAPAGEATDDPSAAAGLECPSCGWSEREESPWGYFIDDRWGRAGE